MKSAEELAPQLIANGCGVCGCDLDFIRAIQADVLETCANLAIDHESVGDADDIDDAVDEACLTLAARIRTLKPEGTDGRGGS